MTQTPPSEDSPAPPRPAPASSWLELAARVRGRLDSLEDTVRGTALSEEVRALAVDCKRLLAHVELLHHETRRWWSASDPMSPEGDSDPAEVEDAEIQRAAVSVRREQHEESRDPMQFIKALLMWVETPQEHAGAAAETRSQP